MSNVMIDLETIGNDYDGIFTNIGACVFNPSTGEIGRTFYKSISWESSIIAGRTVTPATIKWWMEQHEDARKEITKDGEDILTVLQSFRKWLPENAIVWGNGCNFDIGKLETAYGYGNIPWSFWNIRDVRTVVDMSKGLVSKKDIQRVGVAHNALDDAIYQATYVSAMIQAIEESKRLRNSDMAKENEQLKRKIETLTNTLKLTQKR